MLQPILNVFGEYDAPKKGHPYANVSNLHTATEAAVLNQNRHTTCVDCHNGHGAQPTLLSECRREFATHRSMLTA